MENERTITLDPLMEREPLPLPVRRVESTLPAGLRIGWFDGETADPDFPVESFSMTSGAGVGSSWLCLELKMKDGTTISEVVDMAAVALAWIDAAVAAGPTPEVES